MAAGILRLGAYFVPGGTGGFQEAAASAEMQLD